MQTCTHQINGSQPTYFNTISEKDDAHQAVGFSNAHRLKSTIQDISRLTQSSLLAHYLNVDRSDVSCLLSHKILALDMYRDIACSSLSMTEQDILFGYIDQTINALDDGLKLSPARQPI
ncbi:hypothetical protein FM038_012145 [Shewanella eurypsychrophilus]|uniref:Transcriptional regulator n=1 Tax=Shewanella eurypsychrophilus TaxID=2593656 RepID=A0ABX6V991_9GAMM|nr:MULTISPECIES: hypothetical protein [Shewanella]QFU22820.1 hypothetical protein FS418_13725 [Shewanella sp. YLB-09]QPG58107.1 hypothetical protein FM038_012145 [Shewanella eurypsychrophilus]